MARNGSASSASRHRSSGIAELASTRFCLQRRRASNIASMQRAGESAHVAGGALGFPVVQVVDDARLARKQSVGLRFGQGLDIAELPRDRRALASGLVERLADRVEAILRFREKLAEPSEFGLDCSEHAPYLARTLFDRQCPEPHLQAI